MYLSCINDAQNGSTYFNHDFTIINARRNPGFQWCCYSSPLAQGLRPDEETENWLELEEYRQTEATPELAAPEMLGMVYRESDLCWHATHMGCDDDDDNPNGGGANSSVEGMGIKRANPANLISGPI